MFEVEDLSEKALFPRFGMEEVERFGLLFRDAEKKPHKTVIQSAVHFSTMKLGTTVELRSKGFHRTDFIFLID